MLKLINRLFVAVMDRFETSYSFSEKELDLQWRYRASPRHWQVSSTFPFIHISPEETEE